MGTGGDGIHISGNGWEWVKFRSFALLLKGSLICTSYARPSRLTRLRSLASRPLTCRIAAGRPVFITCLRGPTRMHKVHLIGRETTQLFERCRIPTSILTASLPIELQADADCRDWQSTQQPCVHSSCTVRRCLCIWSAHALLCNCRPCILLKMVDFLL